MSHYRISCTVSVNKQRAFPGETLVLETIVENAKLLPVRIRIQWSLAALLNGWVAMSTSSGRRPVFCGTSGHNCSGTLWPGAEVFYRMGPNCIRTGDLLGFLKRRKNREDNEFYHCLSATRSS